MAQSMPADSPPSPRAESTPAAPVANLFCQVVVLHKPDEVPVSGRVAYVQVDQLTAEQAGELVAGLWPSAGQAGTARRFTLLYPTSGEQRAAADAVARLERLAQQEGWLAAAGDALASRQAEAPAVRQWSERAERLSGDWAGWAGKMLAGELAGQVVGDWAGAAERFRSAINTSANGSAEQLLARLRLADALAKRGPVKEARELAAGIVAAPGPLRGSEAAARAGRLLDQLEKQRLERR